MHFNGFLAFLKRCLKLLVRVVAGLKADFKALVLSLHFNKYSINAQ